MNTCRKQNLLRLGLCVSLVLSSCNLFPQDKPAQSTSIPKSDLGMLIDRADKTPQQIARELQLKPTKTYEDFIDLGTAHLWMGEYTRAAESFERAAQSADTLDKLVGALYNKTGALGYGGHMQEALRTADFLVRLRPRNIEIAKLRYALYRYSGDKIGLMTSGDHVLTLDPSLTGKTVMEPSTVILIVIGLSIVAASVTTITVVALVPPEDRGDVVKAIMIGYYSLVKSQPPVNTGEGLSRVLLEPLSNK